jgi:hypothetical protein
MTPDQDDLTAEGLRKLAEVEELIARLALHAREYSPVDDDATEKLGELLSEAAAFIRAQTQRIGELEGGWEEATRQLVALRLSRPPLADIELLSRQFHRAGGADIDRQTRINDWLKAQIADARGESLAAEKAQTSAEREARVAAEARVAELEGALRPFVAVLEEAEATYRRRGGSPDLTPDNVPLFDIASSRLKGGRPFWPVEQKIMALTGTFRAARQALSPEPHRPAAALEPKGEDKP